MARLIFCGYGSVVLFLNSFRGVDASWGPIRYTNTSTIVVTSSSAQVPTTSISSDPISDLSTTKTTKPVSPTFLTSSIATAAPADGNGSQLGASAAVVTSISGNTSTSATIQDPADSPQPNNSTTSPNGTIAEPCSCYVRVPILSYLTWVTVPPGEALWTWTNEQGTATQAVDAYDIAQQTWYDSTITFPTMYSNYNWYYSYHGTMPTTVEGKTTCTTIEPSAVTAFLPSHPTWIGSPPPSVTPAMNDSRGAQYSPQWIIPNAQSTLMNDWRNAFPLSAAYPFHVCVMGMVGAAVPIVAPPQQLTSVSDVKLASKGPQSVAASTTAVVLPEMTSAAAEVVPAPVTSSSTTIFTAPQPAASGQKPNGFPQIALPTATTVKQVEDILPSASSASANDVLIGQPDVLQPTTAVVVATIGGHAVLVSSSAFAVGSTTLTPGAIVTVSTGSDAIVASVQTNTAGITEVVHGGSTIALLKPTQNAPSPSAIVLGEQTVTATSGVYVVQSHTLTPGAVVNIGSQDQPTAAAMLVNAAGETALVVDSHTTTLAAQQTLVTPVATVAGHVVNVVGASQVVVDGTTLTRGTPVAIGSGTATQMAAVQTDSDGRSALVIASSTILLPSTVFLATAASPAVLAFAGQTFAISGDEVFVQGHSISPGESLVLGAGAAATTVAVQIDAAGQTEVIVQGSTTTLHGLATATSPASDLVFAGQTLTPLDNGDLLIAGQILHSDGTITIGSGSRTTVAAFQTDAAGHTELVVDGSTTMLDLPRPITTLTFAQHTVTELADGTIVFNGHTLTPGASATLGSGPDATMAAMITDASGREELVIGSQTTLLPSSRPLMRYSEVMSAGDLTLTRLPGSQTVFGIDGQTVTLGGGSITLGSGSQTTHLALVTDSAGRLEVVEGSSTILLQSSAGSGIGGYVISGLLGGVAAESTTQSGQFSPTLTATSTAKLAAATAGAGRRAETWPLGLLVVAGFVGLLFAL
ncbi:hypothetical protein B0A48_02055 [Cryoendolithus antarcticus]|uniref:Uncharacterized protein n=1 Tax=Cryoendolithus antarcticus TaxID=1507870 RepID=A0A1V8TMI7_9PEZI|nr:hypothetical protein B0A48_02055 [Cryoendolithus antarcticus]